MAAERARTGSARRTEAALVDKLDSLVADNKADDHYRRLFDTVYVLLLPGRDKANSGGACVHGLSTSSIFLLTVLYLSKSVNDTQKLLKISEVFPRSVSVWLGYDMYPLMSILKIHPV